MKEAKKSSSHDFYRKIIRECFWDYRMSVEELLELARNGTEQEKYFLFIKCMEGSTDILQSLCIFSEADRKKMIGRYTPPKFNHHFFDRRYKIVKYFLTGEQVNIPELQWTV